MKVKIRLNKPDDGGLAEPLPVPTRSLLFRFSLEDVERDFGGVLEAKDALVPGSSVESLITFWAEEAEVYATPGASFDVWYGSEVGVGEVLERAEPSDSNA